MHWAEVVVVGLIIAWMGLLVYALCASAGSADDAAALMANAEDDGRRAA